jgi:valyl-tRNA synthetase
MNIERAREAGLAIHPYKGSGDDPNAPSIAASHDGWDGAAQLPIETRWILSRLSTTATEVNNSLAAYRFDEAASAVYQFFWGDLCDWYLEVIKLRLVFAPLIAEGVILTLNNAKDPGGAGITAKELSASNEAALVSLRAFIHIFESALRLLSPFMPFITEEIWHALYDGAPPAKSIALTRFPQSTDFYYDAGAVSMMETMQELIISVRGLRKEMGVPEKEATAIRIHSTAGAAQLAQANADMLVKLARVSAVDLAHSPLSGDGTRSTAAFDVAVLYERQIDVPAERERLTKDLAKYEKGLIAADRQLGNEAFMAKAPANIVAGLRKQQAETTTLYEKTKAALDSLPPE